ncbi:type VI secretion system baseplate subunit TssF [Pseudenhygromyxa sp. WMMC2535]|uniref:type VI secretion system baseplate subunit TssF n=1 Tax=Pseudenhygromyxa sp. WMMC2535 TaxID=2712867 RepID=UPI001553B240|nr:type VI secretion system baseplate subunit TssF [Pseudenhygromyxa sp. WMMC2535]NVB39238.1 type VI secretion system baseplate subunit TssF [Pseudenhygromyxa sp. WMMC2535]
MAIDFDTSFLRELAALDDHLARRRGVARAVEAEDPDVRRLMESLAFFSARTREIATTELRGAVHRLTQGLLDDFVHPQPARALLRAEPSPRLTEPAVLPRGTRVRLETLDGDMGLFSTMRELVVRPLELDRAELQLRGVGVRVLIRLRAFGPTVHVGEPLRLQLDQLGDYERSRQLLAHLEAHLQRVGVVYGDPPSPSEAGEDCEFRLGTQASGRRDPNSAASFIDELSAQSGDGAVAKIREFLHFPAKDLSLELDLPRPPRPWRQAWLCLDLDAWPEGQPVNKDMFRLFCVGIENLFTELAEPIKCDGTRTHHPIRAWRVDEGVAFHSVAEVQQELPSGMDLILPGYLAGGEESWEIDHGEGGAVPLLELRLPGAFLEPRMVMVRARWTQPGFADQALGRLDAQLQSRHVEGVSFRVQGGLIPHRPSPLWGDPKATLHTLSRRSKRVLSREDIAKVMTVLGADARSHHGQVVGELRNVEVFDEPADVRRGGGGLRHVYRVRLAEIDAARRGLVDDYLRCLGELLNTWSSTTSVIRVDEAGARRSAEIVRSAS